MWKPVAVPPWEKCLNNCSVSTDSKVENTQVNEFVYFYIMWLHNLYPAKLYKTLEQDITGVLVSWRWDWLDNKGCVENVWNGLKLD